MKLPRNVSGRDLVKALRVLDYKFVRQDGSHIRLTPQRAGVHHVTITDHNPVRIGTLQGILKAVATHHEISVEELELRT